ncbi:hypothetical protein AMS62_20585 [Bacillus sp. FJAT-18019]|nr:hypothetical protein AMS62_20585 [Bacillus sp. FJAT-18019]
MKFSKRKSYIALYDLLSKRWGNSNKENEDVAIFLGSMSPHISNDSKSADPAYWQDWDTVWQEAELQSDINEGKLLFIIIKFIRNYEELGFELSELIIEIEKQHQNGELFKLLD